MSKLEDNVNEILGIEKKKEVAIKDFEQPAIVPRKIDETLGKLKILKLNIHNDVRNVKKVVRHSETEQYSEEFYKMIDKFMKMPETLSKIAKNKFKKVAEEELKEFLKYINAVELDKGNNIFGMFDV